MKWSDGSYLECQDFWRMSGITRESYLYARNKVHLKDFEIMRTFGDFQLNDYQENDSDRLLIIAKKIK